MARSADVVGLGGEPRQNPRCVSDRGNPRPGEWTLSRWLGSFEAVGSHAENAEYGRDGQRRKNRGGSYNEVTYTLYIVEIKCSYINVMYRPACSFLFRAIIFDRSSFRHHWVVGQRARR